MKTQLSALLLAFVLLSSSGCLKTRAQLRDDDREASKPIPVQPAQEVRPQGQYVIDEIKAEITQLTGRIEDLERAQKEKSSSVEQEEIKKIESRLSLIEQNQAHIQESLSKVEASTALKNPEEVFNHAKALYEDEEYEKAAEAFGKYLKAPKVKKPEEATFLKGESFYKLKQYKTAIVEYSKFPEKYTRSSRLPEALYKIGLSFEALGMKEDAKGFYQELVERFPKSPEAKKAKKKVK
jgi:tol-pal system protein YbgF